MNGQTVPDGAAKAVFPTKNEVYPLAISIQKEDSQFPNRVVSDDLIHWKWTISD